MGADNSHGLSGVQPDSGLRDVNGCQSDDQSYSGQHLKIDERLQAKTSDSAQLSVAGDAGYKRAEDQRGDNHLYQSQKNIAQYADAEGDPRRVDTEFHAGQHSE